MIQDFVWIRLNKAKSKIPNRASCGCQMGVVNFEAFAEKMAEIDHPVQCFIRGHDHFPERFVPMPKYDRIPVYTINTVCCTDDGVVLSPNFCTPPAVIQYDVQAKKLTAWKIVLNSEQVDAWYAPKIIPKTEPNPESTPESTPESIPEP